MEILSFVLNEGLIVIPVLFILGEFIKSTTFVKDKYIPIILLVASVVMTPAVLGAYNVHTVIQAILVAGASVFGDQLLKQAKKDQ